MKNKKEKMDMDFGVCFQQDVEVPNNSKNHNKIGYYFLEMILVFMISYGMLFGFINSFSIEINHGILIGSICFTTLIGGLAFRSPEKGYRFLLFIIEILLFMIFLYRSEFQEGFAKIANHDIPRINTYYGIFIPNFIITIKNTIYLQTLCLVILSSFSIHLICYVVFGGGNRLFYILAVGIYVILPFSVGLAPVRLPLFLFTIGTIALMGGGFRIPKKIAAKIKMMFAVLIFLLFVLITKGFPESKYDETINLNEIKVNLQAGMKELIETEDLRNLFQGDLFSFGGRNHGGISHGKLNKSGELIYSGKTMLRISIPEKQLQKTMFLRCFVGSIYENNEWNGLSKENQGIYEKLVELCKEDFQNLSGKRLKAFPPHSKKESFPNTIMIENIQAGKKNQFLPYSTEEEIKIGKAGNLSIDSIKSEEKYTLAYSQKMNENVIKALKDIVRIEQNDEIFHIGKDNGLTMTEIEYVNEINKADKNNEISGRNEIVREQISGQNMYSNLPLWERLESYFDRAPAIQYDNFNFYRNEAIYRMFVYEVYTKLPKFGAKKAIKEFPEYAGRQSRDLRMSITKFNKTDSYISYANIIKMIKNYLFMDTNYSLKPGMIPKGKDLIDYFLYESKKGYCAHYASAAVILFRSIGIPARYVEGYVVTKNDYKKSSIMDDQLILDIKDKNAHAWVEIYINGLGWAPIEVTKGYSDENRNLKLPVELQMERNQEQLNQSKEPLQTKPDMTEEPVVTPEIIKEPILEENNIGWRISEKQVVALKGMGIFVLFAVSGILLRQHVIRKKRRQILSNRNPNRCVIFQYNEILRMVRTYCGLKKDRMLEKDLKRIIEEVSFITEEQWDKLIFNAKKATFSQGFLEDSERKESDLIYQQCLLGIYKRANKLTKLYYHFIKVF